MVTCTFFFLGLLQVVDSAAAKPCGCITGACRHDGKRVPKKSFKLLDNKQCEEPVQKNDGKKSISGKDKVTRTILNEQAGVQAVNPVEVVTAVVVEAQTGSRQDGKRVPKKPLKLLDNMRYEQVQKNIKQSRGNKAACNSKGKENVTPNIQTAQAGAQVVNPAQVAAEVMAGEVEAQGTSYFPPARFSPDFPPTFKIRPFRWIFFVHYTLHDPNTPQFHYGVGGMSPSCAHETCQPVIIIAYYF